MNVDVKEDLKSKTFHSLQWGSEYCVSVQVAGRGALSLSAVSSKQCVHLPEQGKKHILMMMHSLEMQSIEKNGRKGKSLPYRS